LTAKGDGWDINGGMMMRPLSKALLAVGLFGLMQMGFSSDLGAFSVSETQIFRHGPYTFKLEIQAKGPGKLKRDLIQLSSLKVKIKNERVNSEVLRVKIIRVFQEPNFFKDIETRSYSISPGQWVTKYLRLSKEEKPFLGHKGFIAIVFENFTIQFSPQERKFKGPLNY
jgi:hypothetical protein